MFNICSCIILELDAEFVKRIGSLYEINSISTRGHRNST